MKKITIILITLLIIGVGFLSGCIDTNHNVYDLRYNPNEYLDKEIIVSARYFALDNSIFDEPNALGRIQLLIPSGVNNSMLINGGHYFFKGTLTKGETLPYFKVSEIFTSDPSDNYFSIITNNTCCLAIGVIIVIFIVILFLIGFRGNKKGKEKEYEVKETTHHPIKEMLDVKEDALQDEKQKKYDELKEAGLVYTLDFNFNDFLSISNELGEDEIVLALTKSTTPSVAKVSITNKRIMIRNYDKSGMKPGVGFDINYSEIEKNTITMRKLTGAVHFDVKGRHFVIYNLLPEKHVEDIIRELVEKNIG